MTSAKNQPILDSIRHLAEEMARSSPDCASRAMQIVDLVRSLESEPDEGTVQDALSAEIDDGSFSDVSTRNAAAAVVKALK